MRDQLERAFDIEAGALDDELADGTISIQQYDEEMLDLERDAGHEEWSQSRLDHEFAPTEPAS